MVPQKLPKGVLHPEGLLGPEGGPKTVRYAVGQPMGALSS